jgi:HD superfamily phosphohydrolase YqeK
MTVCGRSMNRDCLIDDDFQLAKIAPEFRSIFKRALPFLQTRNNTIHTYIVYQYALFLLRKEPGSPEIVIPAALLHDVGWSAIPEEKQLAAFGPAVKDPELRRQHEIQGAAIARDILKAEGYEPGLIPEIVSIIEFHDTTRDAHSLNDAITKDADKLFRLSRVGFSMDSQRFHLDPVSYIGYLVGQIDQWFLTRTGKERAGWEAQMREKEIFSNP